jgi:hypothetical protein
MDAAMLFEMVVSVGRLFQCQVSAAWLVNRPKPRQSSASVLFMQHVYENRRPGNHQAYGRNGKMKFSSEKIPSQVG